MPRISSRTTRRLGEKAIVEIVTFGPGLQMLRNDISPGKQRIQQFALETPEVTFAACANTQANMAKQEGKDVPIMTEAKLTPSGVVRLAELQGQGYAYFVHKRVARVAHYDERAFRQAISALCASRARLCTHDRVTCLAHTTAEPPPQSGALNVTEIETPAGTCIRPRSCRRLDYDTRPPMHDWHWSRVAVVTRLSRRDARHSQCRSKRRRRPFAG